MSEHNTDKSNDVETKFEPKVRKLRCPNIILINPMIMKQNLN